MIRVQTGSRLHFGVFRPAAAGGWPNVDGEETHFRRFGGVGLMVQAPGVAVTAWPAEGWRAEGPSAERALDFARRFAQTAPPDQPVPPHSLLIERCAPEHAGLGTGTQLGLAVARALAEASGQPNLEPWQLARRAGRGLRSGVGIHGFAQGNFLVEAGTRPNLCAGGYLPPLVARAAFPDEWRVVMVLPPAGVAGVSGQAEWQAFDQLTSTPVTAAMLAQSDAMCRLVLLGMLPALLERDLSAFGEALYDFNALAGELFATAQGGRYASPAVAELVAFLRGLGVKGVGQSSWGPAVFAVVADAEEAESLRPRLRGRIGAGGHVVVTAASPTGARVTRL